MGDKFNFSGDESSNEVALRMILSKIQEDPQSGSCLNISYSDMTGFKTVIQSIIKLMIHHYHHFHDLDLVASTRALPSSKIINVIINHQCIIINIVVIIDIKRIIF